MAATKATSARASTGKSKSTSTARRAPASKKIEMPVMPEGASQFKQPVRTRKDVQSVRDPSSGDILAVAVVVFMSIVAAVSTQREVGSGAIPAPKPAVTRQEEEKRPVRDDTTMRSDCKTRIAYNERNGWPAPAECTGGN